ATHSVDEGRRSGNIAAHAPEGLGQRAFDDGQAVRLAVALADASAARAVETDRMYFVEIGHGTIAFCEIADPGDGRDIAVHGVDALEGNQLRSLRVRRAQQLLEMLHVVVAEDAPIAARLADAVDHRGMIE